MEANMFNEEHGMLLGAALGRPHVYVGVVYDGGCCH
jgi:hypothetical protein